MKVWTDKEDKFIHENYLTMTNREMGNILNLNKKTVQSRMRTLGLRRPDHIREKMRASTQFKKGQKSWNKGVKGLHFSPATEFKKGNTPHNTKKDGTISIRFHKRDNRAYKYIRISKSKWQLLHRYNWEKVNGTIPKTHVLRFHDGNTLNCDLDNLFCISKAENCIKNSNIEHDGKVAFWISPKNKELREKIKKEAPELIELKRAELKLRRAINEQLK